MNARRHPNAVISSASMTPSAAKVRYSPISVREATFKAGQAAHVHRWFRLTPSFGPDLVREMLSAMECREDDVVLDPFAGAGTTLIEAKLAGLTAHGFEINPLLHFVGETSVRWEIDQDLLDDALSMISAAFVDARAEAPTLDELAVPPIHNPTRWWRPDVLVDLVLLRDAIDRAVPAGGVRDFFRLALAGVLVPDLTNVTLGRLQLHFITRDEDDIDVWRTFAQHAATMIGDVRTLARDVDAGTAKTYLTDATAPSHEIAPGSVGCVVTSPPYPNRYSYVWNTRPHLYFLDFFSTPKEAGDLDKATIGGTWGIATSHLAKGSVEPLNAAVEEVASHVTAQIRTADNLMANYVMKYFNLLGAQLLAMEGVLADDARLAYVIGCSRIKGVFIESDVLLAELIKRLELGFEITDIHRMRKRNSGVDLHESIVYAAR
jgi:hypothetical protein